MVEDRVTAAEKRLDLIEQDLVKIRKSLHRARNLTAIMGASLKKEMKAVAEAQAEILKFVSGASTILGFARKNWKMALTFGAGLMTALGVGNPEVTKFIVAFFT